jgi:hypothetical protein
VADDDEKERERVEITVLRDPWEVEPRLKDLGLSLESLLTVVNMAIHAARNATPNHCANAAGTYAYQDGTFGLRDKFVGENKDWAVDRTNGVEAIFNAKLKVSVIFSNVDIACNDQQLPRPRSAKGAGAERACVGNLLFGDGELPRYAPTAPKGQATFYLMVDERGASELSRPVIKGRTFSAFIERIYLSGGGDGFEKAKLPLNADDAANDFNPQVVRK